MSEYFDLKTINTAISTTLAEATGISRVEDLEDLTENIPEMDLPLIQVVPTTWSGASGSQTHLNTFGGEGTNAVPVKRKQWVYNIYVFVSTYARFAEGMAKAAEIGAAITEVLDAQDKPPLFGAKAIRSYTYLAERGVIPYSNVEYIGINITLTLELF